MFDNSISDFFRGKSRLEFDKDGEPSSQDVRIAVVVLMISLARQDGDFCPSEGKGVARALSRHFGLNETEAIELTELVSPLSKNFDNIEEFVSIVNEKFNEEQKQLVLAMIWSLALADGVADRLETNFATVLRNRLNLTIDQAVTARQLAEEQDQDIALALTAATKSADLHH